MPRIRFQTRLPVDVVSKRDSVCTITFEIQALHDKHAVIMRESGKVGYWELHAFGAWETSRVDELLYRIGVDFDRGMAAKVAYRLIQLGLAEPIQ